MLIAPVEIDLDRGDDVVLAEAHDRALAELLFDLADGDVERLHSFLSFRASSVGGMCVGPFGTRLILETRQAKVKRKSVQ